MSKETLHLLLRMNHDRLETQIALQCAPLLTGVKISNLLTVASDRKQEAEGLFEGTAVSCYMLYESGEKTTFLLYLRSGLTEYLAKEDVKRLMERFGYHAMKLERILERVSEKYTSYMDGTGGRVNIHSRHPAERNFHTYPSGFPHEIGLLLGYPPADVQGFIRNNGQNYLCTGYWKVYSNQSECKRIFRGYSQARERLIYMVSHGMGIGDILKIHGLHQYKSITI